MKLRKASLEEIRNSQGGAVGRNIRLIEEFIESDLTVAEVVDYPHSSPKSCLSSLYNTIKKQRYGGVRVTGIKDKVYLVKTPLEKGKEEV